MNVTSRQLGAFLAVAHERAFGRAAERLSMTTSGVSSLIRELEAQLGFRLFDRTTRRVRLTPFGERFLPVAAGNLETLEAAVRQIGRSASAADHRITVGATPTIAASLVPEVMAAFRRRHPEVEVRLVDAEPDVMLAGIEAGEIDLGLGMFLKPAAGMKRTPVLRSPLVAILPETAGRAARQTLRWADLRERGLVTLPPGNPLSDLLDAHRPSQAGKPAAGRSSAHPAAPLPAQAADIAVSYVATQVSMVEAGFGVAVLPAVLLPAFRGRRLRVARLVDPVVEVALFEVRDSSRRAAPAVDRFSAVVAEAGEAWVRRARASLAARAAG